MTESTQRAPGAVAWDVRRLLYFAVAAFLVVALWSYSPSDPSWSTWSSSRYIGNTLGRLGSLVADLLAQCFGLAAFAFPALALAMACRRRPTAPVERAERIERAAVFALYVGALATMLETQLGDGPLPMSLSHAGGALGFLLARGLRFLVGARGAAALAMLGFVVATMVLFRWAILTWFGQQALTIGKALQAKWGWPPRFAAKFLRSPWAKKETGTAIVPAMASKPSVTSAMPTVPPISGPSAPTPTATPLRKLAEVAIATASLAADAEELARLLPKRSAPTREKETKRPARKPGQAFELPELDILSGRAEAKVKTVDRSWYLEKATILVEKLKDFGVEGEVVNISPGPVITVYEFKPASGVKIKEIANLSDDLTLALSVLSVRIVAPIPGKPVVGIEIPSPFRETVYFKDLVQETGFYDPAVRIPIVLGRLASGEPVIAGLASMPHMLVAGSTGTGKSVFINTLIASLLYRYTPEQLKLILVDPKMVELASYEGIPHLLLPVVVDSRKAAMALRWAVDEMERRYSMLHEAGVRHIDAYNEKIETAEQPPEDGQTKLPYIVVVIDEYADLMATVPKDVELSITRLAQKARASGIHLVLATQRPSTDVVTGTIKANFPSRISFRVASSVDSKTILDRTGADRLLGAGDMLFHSAGFTTLKRLQGAFLSDAELERVVNHWREQGEPEYDERLLQYQEEAAEATEGELESESGGDLYDRAVRLVAEKGEASISLIQRHLKIGYNRAASLMEEMEKQGIVAQQTGNTKRRAVLVSPT